MLPSDGEDPEPKQPAFVRMLVSFARMFMQGLLRICQAISSLFQGNTGLRFGLLFMAFLSFQAWRQDARGGAAATTTDVLYSQFVTFARAGAVHSALVDDQSNTLYFSVDPAKVRAAAAGRRRWFARPPAPAPAAATTRLQGFSTRLVDRDTSYVSVLVDNNVHFGVKRQTLSGAITKMAGAFLALWIPLIPFFIVFKRVLDAQGGKSKASKQSAEPPDTTFADVAGVDVVKAELEEAVQCLRNPEKFEKLNAKMPSGVLLCGPPGTGKTLLARAVAGEAGVPFFAVSASEFVEMFVGRGAARIRELFAQARKAAPAVVFIDELDAVGAKRGMGVNDERDQTLNQLLTELDGFEKRPSVLLLAATNRPEILDPALLRPGRISRRIVVPLPDEAGRRDILRVHLRGIPMESESFKEEAVAYLASITRGFSGAELFNTVNEGALLAARRSDEVVALTDLVNGVTRTRDGVNSRAAPLGKALARLAEAVTPRAPEPTRASPLY